MSLNKTEDDDDLLSHSIMIVDDEPDQIELFTEVLNTNGYQVIGFGDRRVALEHLKQNQEIFD